MSIIAPARPASYLPRVTCAQWCEYGDGHPGQVFTEDQVCTAPPARTPLGWSGDQVSAYPVGTVSTEALVAVGITANGRTAERMLTVAQLDRHIAALVAARDAAMEHNASLRSCQGGIVW